MAFYKIVSLSLLLIGSFNVSAYEAFNFKPFTNRVIYNKADTATADKFSFKFPSMELIDHRNQAVELGELFETDRNVVFAFLLPLCQCRVCTTVTLSLKSIQPHLPDNTKIIMISIDPDTDTPDVLEQYANNHRINDSNWQLLTGSNKNIIDLQKSFEAYRGNKMNHNTSLFIKKSNSEVITEIKNNFSSIPKLLSQTTHG